MTKQEEVQRFEDVTGVDYDESGPEPTPCEGCDTPIQYVDDHECGYTRAMNAEAAWFEDAAYGPRDDY